MRNVSYQQTQATAETSTAQRDSKYAPAQSAFGGVFSSHSQSQQFLALQRKLGNQAVTQMLRSTLKKGQVAQHKVAQRKVAVENIQDGAPFAEDADYGQKEWNLSPAEMGLFKRWVKDPADHKFPTKEALHAALHRMATQPFGTDIGKLNEDEQLQVFKDALETGYRVFDSAATYLTLEVLWKAVKELQIPEDEITVIYKLKPVSDKEIDADVEKLEQDLVNEKNSEKPRAAELLGLRKRIKDRKNDGKEQKIEMAKEAMDGKMPGVLMLHEMHSSMEVNREHLTYLIQFVKEGQAKAVGVSNVDIYQLQDLYEHSQSLGVPITYVQNQFSPYLTADTEVPNFCQEHNIQLMGYGLMGSAQVGACAGVGNEGEGLPTQYLLARHDPRIQEVAKRENTTEGELLLAWAQRKGVQTISSSTDKERIGKNFGVAEFVMSEELFQELEGMFTKVPDEKAEEVDGWNGDDEAVGPLKALYQSNPDPTAWHVLDSLKSSDPSVEDLLNRVAHVVIANNSNQDEQVNALKNVTLSLIRQVADLQSTVQKIIKAKEIPPFTDWRDNLIPQFKSIADAAQDDAVFQLFFGWATRNPFEGHTMADCMVVLGEIAGSGVEQEQGHAAEQQQLPVEVPEETVDVTYDEDLYTEDVEVIAKETYAELAVGTEIYYQPLGKSLYVKENQAMHRKIILTNRKL